MAPLDDPQATPHPRVQSLETVAWTALRQRECFPRPGAWEETFRSLVPDVARVLVLSDGKLGDEATALLRQVFHRVSAQKVVAALPAGARETALPGTAVL